MTSSVQQRIQRTAERLAREIETYPRLNSTFGGLLRNRLKDEDWIKSQNLVWQLRPLDAHPYPHHPEGFPQVSPELPPSALYIEGTEWLLTRYEEHGVAGVGAWPKEIGKAQGVDLDRELYVRNYEIKAVAPFVGGPFGITKLGASKEKKPDFHITAETADLLLECKSDAGPNMLLDSLAAAVEAIEVYGQMPEASQAMIVARVPEEITVAHLQADLRRISTEELISAMAEYSATKSNVDVGKWLTVTMRSGFAANSTVRASLTSLATSADLDMEFALREASYSVTDAIYKGWKQCEAFEPPDPYADRFDAVSIEPLFWTAQTQAYSDVLSWLHEEVWPTKPHRVVITTVNDREWPQLFTSDAVSAQFAKAFNVAVPG